MSRSARLAIVSITMALALLLVRCSDDNAGQDAGIKDSSADLQTADLRGPDQKIVGKDLMPDGAASGCDPSKLAKTCTKDSECGTKGLCLKINDKVSICSCNCTPDNPNTSMVNEDTCPNQGAKVGNFVCGAPTAAVDGGAAKDGGKAKDAGPG